MSVPIELLGKRAHLLTRVGEEQRRSGERIVSALMDALYSEIRSEIELRAEAELEPKRRPDGALETVGSDRTSYVRGMHDALDVVRQACRLVKGHEPL